VAFRAGEQRAALNQLARSDRTHLVSLCFEGGRGRVRHAVAVSTSAGNVALFDPNYGEFSSRASELPTLFGDLMARYGSRLNGRLQLESMVLQRVE
jgi:YopT-type cysteine protease-like protein